MLKLIMTQVNKLMSNGMSYAESLQAILSSTFVSTTAQATMRQNQKLTKSLILLWI